MKKSTLFSAVIIWHYCQFYAIGKVRKEYRRDFQDRKKETTKK